jgi:hypothetical protein
MDFLRDIFGKKPKIKLSEFNLFTEPAYAQWMKWKTYVVECNFKYPMPSMQAVMAIEQGTNRMPDTLLNNIRELDDRLGLKGTLFMVFMDLEETIHRFKSSPDGSGFQNLGMKVEKAVALLDQLKSKHTFAR